MSAHGKCRRGPRYVSLIAVLARDLFGLLELMRFEGCYPTTEAESLKMFALAEHSIDEATVRLWMVSGSDRSPNADRLRSFGVVLLGQWHPDDSPPSDEHLAHLAALAKTGASS
jgi:hypothetical protein